MSDLGMENGAPSAGASVLEKIASRIFRCHHRRQTRPFTPRGEDQCYAVCLDCGQRILSEFKMNLPEPPLKDGSLAQETSPAPEPGKTAAPNSLSPERWRQTWKHDLLWVGLFAVGLSGGLYYSRHMRLAPPSAAMPRPAPAPLPDSPTVTPPSSQEDSAPVEIAPTPTVSAAPKPATTKAPRQDEDAARAD